MYEFCYHYLNPKCGEHVETRFDTSNHELDRPLPKGKNKSNWINGRRIWRKYNDRICWINLLDWLFGKTMGNVKKYRDITHVKTE